MQAYPNNIAFTPQGAAEAADNMDRPGLPAVTRL
jgi:hypothetical protein